MKRRRRNPKALDSLITYGALAGLAYGGYVLYQKQKLANVGPVPTNQPVGTPGYPNPDGSPFGTSGGHDSSAGR